ncbi:MAG: DUF4861 family protein [Bryobacterales bacterium]|nr:DUF4861 family protein [Bryobacterales bacterium]
MMRSISGCGLGLLLLAGLATGQASPWSQWLLPNFSGRLSVDVRNPAAVPVEAVASIPVVEAAATAPDFPGSLAIALAAGGNVVPSQTVDLDGDGVPDQFLVLMKLAAGETRRVDVYYSRTLHDSIAYPKRVQAKHSFGYNSQTAALESEVIGYRTYGAFFLDVQARLQGHTGLNNDLVGYLAIRMNFDAGRDIFHAGDTLGLGGIFLRRDGVVYRPPFNVPDYAHKPSPAMVPHYRVISAGPLRAVVEATLDRWKIGEDTVRLTARYSIDAGQGFARCRFEVAPIDVKPGHVFEVGVGVRDLPGGIAESRPGLLLATGNQDPKIGNIGLAVYYDPAFYEPAAPLVLKESANQIAVLAARLTAGNAVQGEYAAAGAWSGSGIPDAARYLPALAPEVRNRLETGGVLYNATPRPERLDQEAQ